MLALALWSPLAHATEAEPPSGVAPLVTGLILTGVGAVNAISAPICKTDVYYDYVGSVQAQNVCLGTSIGLAVGGLAVGIPLTFYGLGQHKEHDAWEASQVTLLVEPRAGGALLGLGARF